MNIFFIIMPNGAALVHPLSALNSKYLEPSKSSALKILQVSSLGLSLKISFRRIEFHVQAELALELEKSIPTKREPTLRQCSSHHLRHM